MWMQVVGKISLQLTPRTNHYWNSAFHYTPRGLSTLPMIAGEQTLTIAFDFVDHQLVFQLSDGRTRVNPLRPQTVADFYRETMATLSELGVSVRIWTMPVEIPDPIRTHSAHSRFAASLTSLMWPRWAHALPSMAPTSVPAPRDPIP